MAMYPEQRIEAIHKEIGALARFVENAMKAVAEVCRPVVESSEELPAVASHLTDLVKMTEEGVLEVMRLAELIQDNRALVTRECQTIADTLRRGDHGTLAERVGKIMSALDQDEQRLMEIMTALSFQDLAAQRVKKLVAILEEVREKLLKLVVVVGAEQQQNGEPERGKTNELLNELRQSQDGALKQQTADEILARFGFQ
ncbi:MAG: protein phosphatase CheZ [Nitrospira sp.]|nr:protein phosphatase CheZ [Nitrospira sp.]MCP9442256.1 protein phosphatase CheZ [Nitrospira sp.]